VPGKSDESINDINRMPQASLNNHVRIMFWKVLYYYPYRSRIQFDNFD